VTTESSSETAPETASGTAPEPASLEALVHRLAGLLIRAHDGHGGGLTSGEVAALRRMDPRRLETPFFKVSGLVLDEHLPGEARARERAETKWAAILVGLSHLGDLHRPGVRLGRALVDAEFSELRFSRLVRADDERLVDELPALARFLAAKGVPADFSFAARLILSAGRDNGERTRRALARDYYGALAADSRT
jgi:CRISPR system Cascade subunit CasB